MVQTVEAQEAEQVWLKTACSRSKGFQTRQNNAEGKSKQMVFRTGTGGLDCSGSIEDQAERD